MNSNIVFVSRKEASATNISVLINMPWNTGALKKIDHFTLRPSNTQRLLAYHTSKGLQTTLWEPRETLLRNVHEIITKPPALIRSLRLSKNTGLPIWKKFFLQTNTYTNAYTQLLSNIQYGEQ